MTEEEKTKIHNMVGMGYSYKQIASSLSIPSGTVKSYCYRATKRGLLKPPTKTEDPSLCKQCGQPLIQTPKRKKKIFCSNECRQSWWNAHLYLIKQSSKSLYQFVCPTCNKTFFAYGNKGRKFCSHKCYITSRYYRHGVSDDK